MYHAGNSKSSRILRITRPVITWRITTPWGAGGGGTPYNGLYGEAPPERGTFSRLQVYERVANLLVEVCERVGKSVKGLTDAFYGFIKSRKASIFVTDSYLNDSEFKGVQRDAMQSSKQGM